MVSVREDFENPSSVLLEKPEDFYPLEKLFGDDILINLSNGRRSFKKYREGERKRKK